MQNLMTNSIMLRRCRRPGDRVDRRQRQRNDFAGGPRDTGVGPTENELAASIQGPAEAKARERRLIDQKAG